MKSKKIIFLIKAAVSILCITLLYRSVDWLELTTLFTRIQMSWIILALIIFWIAQVISALRCAYIARVLGKHLDLATSVRAHFIGLWFNQVLPTSLGGDVIKVALLSKVLGFGLAVRSAILDRLSGLIFLMAATALALPIYARILPNRELLSGLTLLAIGFMLALIVSILISGWIINQLKPYPLMNHLTQLLADLSTLARGKALWQQIWTSAIVHFNGIAAYALLGLALGVKVDPVLFALMVPLVFLIALMPLSVAGWGVREVGAVWLFGLVGVDRESALAISICFGILLVISGLPGLILFIFSESHNKNPA